MYDFQVRLSGYAQHRTPYDRQAREATTAAQDVMTTDKLYLEPHLKRS